MEKILVTGGAGFIGTNVVEYFIKQKDFDVLSLDINAPKINEHRKFWKQVDLCDKSALISEVRKFSPDYVIHLGARTDLMGTCVDDYKANTDGVANLLEALDGVANLKRAVFTSSMLVCRVGYHPKDENDYAPSTFYGESKIQTEELVKHHQTHYAWSLIRPTSIWGPWFGVPYANFFKMVLSHTYFNLGNKACNKTYGYIDNAVYQIVSLLKADEIEMNRKVFYIGDYEPYNISEWAKEIGKAANIFIPTIPFFLFQIGAKVGDVLKAMHLPFPLTTFRLKNMTTDNVMDTTPIRKIAPQLPVSRKEGNVRTIEWLNSQK